MRIVCLLLAILSYGCAAEGWISVSNKRVLHLRTDVGNYALFDIRCSNTYDILLGASFLTAELADQEIINKLVIDDVPYPNYLAPETPPPNLVTFNAFWDALRNAKRLVVVVDGKPRKVSTLNLADVLPPAESPGFSCRPVTTEGTLIQ